MPNGVSLQFGCVKIIDCLNGYWLNGYWKERCEKCLNPTWVRCCAISQLPTLCFFHQEMLQGSGPLMALVKQCCRAAPLLPSLPPPAAALGLWVVSAPLKNDPCPFEPESRN